MAFAPTDRASPYGYDVAIGPTPSGQPDMDRSGRACSGGELVRNALIARSMADTLPMIGAPGGRVPFGVDVRAWVGSPMTDATRSQRQQQLVIAYNRDPRLDPGYTNIAIETTRAGSQYAFAIRVTARTTEAVPIAFVVGVNALTVELMAERGQVAV